VKWLKEAESESLASIRFAVFGCGDTNWASTYQSIPTLLDEKLAEKGARRIVQKGQGDASADFDNQFETWHEQLWPAVFNALGIEDSEKRAENSLSIQFISLQNPDFQQVASSMGTLQTTSLPQNSSELVERVLKRFALESNEQLILSGDKGKMFHLPLEFPIRSWDLLKYSVNLEERVTQLQLRELIEWTVCPPHKKELEQLEKNEEMIAQKELTILDLLEKYPACELPFERFIQMLSPLKG
jgi:cytochrome P450/NADPH-cytochrome P450 reductase